MTGTGSRITSAVPWECLDAAPALAAAAAGTEDGPAGGGWDPLLTSASTARDLLGVIIPLKTVGLAL